RRDRSRRNHGPQLGRGRDAARARRRQRRALHRTARHGRGRGTLLHARGGLARQRSQSSLGLLVNAEQPIPGAIGADEIAGELGRGGMGVVYRALSPGPNKIEVAIKVLRSDRADLAKRFTREARIKIDHPNVVKQIEAGETADGTAYIVFELLEGESL